MMRYFLYCIHAALTVISFVSPTAAAEVLQSSPINSDLNSPYPWETMQRITIEADETFLIPKAEMLCFDRLLRDVFFNSETTVVVVEAPNDR